jgi:hypothetical protein
MSYDGAKHARIEASWRKRGRHIEGTDQAIDRSALSETMGTTAYITKV